MTTNRNQAFLASWVQRVQECEDAAWVLLDAISSQAWSGDLLDKIGALVGESRDGRRDVEYLAAVRIRIRVNRSTGRAEDVIDVARLASVNSTPSYTEAYPAMFVVEALALPGGGSVAKLLRSTRAVGVYGVLNFQATGTAPFELDDALTTLDEATPLADARAGSFDFPLSSSVTGDASVVMSLDDAVTTFATAALADSVSGSYDYPMTCALAI